MGRETRSSLLFEFDSREITGGGGPALKAAIKVAASTSPPRHLDIFKGAPLRLPKPLSDQFPVRVGSCPLCIINRP